jgi:hypothetical protein
LILLDHFFSWKQPVRKVKDYNPPFPFPDKKKEIEKKEGRPKTVSKSLYDTESIH